MLTLLQPPLLPERVLMTGDCVGGVWTYALELVRGLKKYMVEVAFATMGAALTTAQRREAAAVSNLQIYESTFKLEWMDDPWDDLKRAGDWLLGLEQAISPDLVHLNTYIHGALPWRAPTLVVGHSCVLSWWQAVKGEAAPSTWESYRYAVRQGLEAAAMVIAPSRAMLQEVFRHYGTQLPEGRVIANGLNPGAFPAAPEKKPCILAAGRLWDEAKNVQALEDVAPRLTWPIHVAGDDRHPDGGRKTSTSVCFLGRLSSEAMKQHMAQAAIYALPARYEPFGLSVLEAALCRCALVLGDIASLRENWEGAALFVDPDDSEELFAALNKLIKSEKLRVDLAGRARRRSLTLNTERMAKGYLDVYKEILQQEMPAVKPHQVHRPYYFHHH